MYVIYAYIRIQIIVETKTIIVVIVRVLPVLVLLVLVLLVRVLLTRVLLVQSSPVREIPYAMFHSGVIFLDQSQFFATHSNQRNCFILYR